MQLVRYQATGHGPRIGLLENGLVYDLEAGSGGRAAGGDMRAFIGQGKRAVDEVVAAGRKRRGARQERQAAGADLQPGQAHRRRRRLPQHRATRSARRDPDALRQEDGRHQGPGRPDHDLEEVARRCGRDRGRDRHRQGGQGHPARAKAMDHVIGYTICNDVSGRELAMPPPGRRDKEMDGFLDWLNGKWMDGFAILGPAIVTKSEAGDLGDVRIRAAFRATSASTGLPGTSTSPGTS